MYSYVNIHTHHVGEGINILDVGEGNAWIVSERARVVNDNQEVFYSAGIHPMRVRGEDEEAVSVIAQTALLDRVIAIGECGLDRRSTISVKDQDQVLTEQVVLAERLRKPLIIHCVRAYSELIAVRKRSRSTVPWIIHGFDNNEQILNQLLEHGFYISIGAALLDPRSNAFRLIRKIPLKSLFLENDDEVVEIGIVYEAASCMLGVDVKGLRKILWENYNKVFNR